MRPTAAYTPAAIALGADRTTALWSRSWLHDGATMRRYPSGSVKVQAPCRGQ